ncbi:hypothetical protein FBZ83_106245 [Azospirillum brasilense]|uniref:Uncharacterized protein n=1 Tax=Azospirillum brasilense TaxID=192 RepID=A0A560CDY0_AZOBR|nr:hypothetical protein FBZ83_106245 [Azospirillum brasilense]
MPKDLQTFVQEPWKAVTALKRGIVGTAKTTIR